MELSPDFREARRNRLILMALCVVFYFTFVLVTPPLLDDADSVHAEVAREMLVRHDFVTLYANGIRYLEKAPLFYWMMALSMRLFGAIAAASRLPLSFSVAALTLVSEAFARRACNARAGLYAGLITLSSFGIFIFSRINIPDVPVCFLLTAALFAYFLTDTQAAPNRSLCWAFAAACALDVLTKGLIGIVFPVAIVALHLAATRGLSGAWRRLRSLHPLTSLAVFLAIAVPWHVLVALANPSQGSPAGISWSNGHLAVPLPTQGHVHGWVWFYFVNEQVLRYLNLRVPRDYDTVPLWLFLGLIFVWLLPWSAYLPSAIAHALPWRDKLLRQRARNHSLSTAERTGLLLLLWAALPLAFFSLSTRQEYYLLPSLPPMIFLVARFLAYRAETKPLAEAHRVETARCAAVLAILGLIAAAFCTYLLLHTKAVAPGTDLSTLLQQNPGDYALSFGHFLDLNVNALSMFRLPLALTILFGILLIAAYILRRPYNYAVIPLMVLVPRHKRPELNRKIDLGPHVFAANLMTAAAAFLFLIAADRALVIFSPTLTSAQLARAIAPQLRPGDMLAIHGEYESGSTLGFYLRRNDLHIVEGRSSNLWYGSFFPDAPALFETRDSLAQKWRGPQRIFLWQDPHDADRPVLPLSPAYVVASSGGKQILSNQPNR